MIFAFTQTRRTNKHPRNKMLPRSPNPSRFATQGGQDSNAHASKQRSKQFDRLIPRRTYQLSASPAAPLPLFITLPSLQETSLCDTKAPKSHSLGLDPTCAVLTGPPKSSATAARKLRFKAKARSVDSDSYTPPRKLSTVRQDRDISRYSDGTPARKQSRYRKQLRMTQKGNNRQAACTTNGGAAEDSELTVQCDVAAISSRTTSGNRVTKPAESISLTDLADRLLALEMARSSRQKTHSLRPRDDRDICRQGDYC